MFKMENLKWERLRAIVIRSCVGVKVKRPCNSETRTLTTVFTAKPQPFAIGSKGAQCRSLGS